MTTVCGGKGLDPRDLYAQNHAVGAPPEVTYPTIFNRIKDLIDNYHPD